MRKIFWEVRTISPPPVVRLCKRCGEKTEYVSSGLFRVNAQKRLLDVWLIYHCSGCDTTWNLPVHSRVSPQSLGRERLEGYLGNDAKLALRTAVDAAKRGLQTGEPEYAITGEDLPAGETVELHLCGDYPYRVSKLLRERLSVSQRELDGMVGQDIRKWKLRGETVLTIQLR